MTSTFGLISSSVNIEGTKMIPRGYRDITTPLSIVTKFSLLMMRLFGLLTKASKSIDLSLEPDANSMTPDGQAAPSLMNSTDAGIRTLL